jgi:hypothetical protein
LTIDNDAIEIEIDGRHCEKVTKQVWQKGKMMKETAALAVYACRHCEERSNPDYRALDCFVPRNDVRQSHCQFVHCQLYCRYPSLRESYRCHDHISASGHSNNHAQSFKFPCLVIQITVLGHSNPHHGSLCANCESGLPLAATLQQSK